MIAASSLRLSSRYCARFHPWWSDDDDDDDDDDRQRVFFYLYETLISAQVFVSLFDFDLRECFCMILTNVEMMVYTKITTKMMMYVTNNASFYVTSAFEDDAVHDRE